MRGPGRLTRRKRRTGGGKSAGRPLAAQLDNPYTPRFGAPRRFEDLARRKGDAAPAPPAQGGERRI